MTFIQHDESATYPDGRYAYSPGVKHPEYPWDGASLASEKNDVYEMVRNCLHGRGYDSANYETVAWNPLGDIIKKGQTVLVKPNWVSHKNKAGFDDKLECLVTHPSVVRAVIDYIVIALCGNGEIILADAPMQGTDIEEMWDISGYRPLFSFICKQKSRIKFRIFDLRKYSVLSKGSIILEAMNNANDPGSVTVELGALSMHSEKNHMRPKYKVSDYSSKDTKEFHSNGRHAYDVSACALNADVVINLPKPKTHRLAGITAAMKNFVGIAHEKASLPHRIIGDSERGGGDAYGAKSIWKSWMEELDDCQVSASQQKRFFIARTLNVLQKCCFLIGAFLSNDVYRIGSWYGNDTIWRTVVDLNYILLYADKRGTIRTEPQRKVLTLGDMIICGEKEGPIGPSPKSLGVIMCSDSVVVFDYVMCAIMGFNPEKIRSISDKNALSMLGYPDVSVLSQEIIFSNDMTLNSRRISEAELNPTWGFEPHSTWKGHIERTSPVKNGV